jgi:GNAT superfamily N-acetyltransferase
MTDAPTATIREFRYGDMGAIVTAQAEFHAASYGWRGVMEQLLLEVCSDFLRDHRPGRSNCRVAAADGRIVGSIFCCVSSDGSAQLRLLYIDAAARGQGLGTRLIDTCVGFARAADYPRLWLWTHAVLLPARRLYAAAGFVVTTTETHDTFGKPEPGETWELRLGGGDGDARSGHSTNFAK